MKNQLPRQVEDFANLSRIRDRPGIASNKHILHSSRRDWVIVLPPHADVGQSGRLPEPFDELCKPHLTGESHRSETTMRQYAFDAAVADGPITMTAYRAVDAAGRIYT
jgi:hypothetical protein